MKAKRNKKQKDKEDNELLKLDTKELKEKTPSTLKKLTQAGNRYRGAPR